MKRIAFFILMSLFISSPKVEAQGIDSLNITSTFITVQEPWYTDYFTGYAIYTGRSFFKDENGGLHVAFIANYKLYYCFSEDGTTWSTEQISNGHDGDFREAVIYADANGTPHIAVTVNPYFDYGNPTGVSFGNEFRFSVYYFSKIGETWEEQEVYNSTLVSGFSGNYGCRVNEIYQNMDGEMVIIGSRYGWYTYGGALWEFTRSTEGTWSDLNIIHNYSDTPVDHATDLSRVYLKDNGERFLIYPRSYNSSGIAELAYMHYSGTAWTTPVVLTTDLINHGSWDLSIGPDEEMYMIHYSNNPTPHVNLFTNFEAATQLDIDLSMVASIQHAKVHITADGILDLMVYPADVDTALLYASEDYGLTWSDPMNVAKSDFPGVLPVADQYSNQGVDLEYINLSRVSTVEPYGPDSIFYNHIEQVNSSILSSGAQRIEIDPFTFYPNPVADNVTINYYLENPDLLLIRVFSLEGKLVMDTQYRGDAGNNEIRMNLGHLDSGTYIIEVSEFNQDKDYISMPTSKVVKL